MAQWVGVIRRAQTSHGMYSSAALLSQTASQVDDITDPLKDWPFRRALHYLEKVAYDKGRFLSQVERGQIRYSFQKQIFNQGIEIRLSTALRMVRGDFGGATPANRNPNGNKWKLKFPT